jgi:hypothetical protein
MYRFRSLLFSVSTCFAAALPIAVKVPPVTAV